MDRFTEKRLHDFKTEISGLPQSINMHMTKLAADGNPLINLSKLFYKYAVEAMGNIRSNPDQNMDELVSKIEDIDGQIKSYIKKHILVSDDDDSGMLHSNLDEEDDFSMNMIGDDIDKPSAEDFLKSNVAEYASYKSIIAQFKM